MAHVSSKVICCLEELRAFNVKTLDKIAKFYEKEGKHHFTGDLSVYKGVLVFWDEDYDTRVLTFIDDLGRERRKLLVAVMETEATLTLVWDVKRPEMIPLREGEYVEVEGDRWYICKSVLLKDII